MRLDQQLPLERCPHCHVHRPLLVQYFSTQTTAFGGANPRTWVVYECRACGGIVVAWARTIHHPNGKVAAGEVEGTLPKQDELSDEIPSTARRYLHQAQETLHAPDGAVMLAASAVDAMLKAKSYRDGSLYSRIKKAADAHLITADMALWAHHVRLEANDPRHVDEDAPHKSPEEAKQAMEFAIALANFLFVLPSRVTRGLKEAGGTPVAEGGRPPETE